MKSGSSYNCASMPKWFPSTFTMTPANSTISVWSYDNYYSRLSDTGVGSVVPVKPVINLLKSSI